MFKLSPRSPRSPDAKTEFTANSNNVEPASKEKEIKIDPYGSPVQLRRATNQWWANTFDS